MDDNEDREERLEAIRNEHRRQEAADRADAARMRWMLAGNGYFMEERGLCGHAPCSQEEQDEARREIDAAMEEDAPPNT